MTTHHGVKADDYVFLDVRQELVGKKWPYVLYASRFVNGQATGSPVRQIIGTGTQLVKEITRNVDHALQEYKIPVVVQAIDKTSAGHFGIYYTNGRLVRGEIQSVHGMLGPRCTPIAAGVKPATPGSVSASERRRTMAASRVWEDLHDLVDTGHFWFKLGETPEKTEVKNAEQSPGAGWIQAKAAHLASIVYPAILQKWKGHKTFGTFPTFPAGDPIGTQTSYADLQATFQRTITEAGGTRPARTTRAAETATERQGPVVITTPRRQPRSTAVDKPKPADKPPRTQRATPSAAPAAAHRRGGKTPAPAAAPDMKAAADVVGAMVKNLFG